MVRIALIGTGAEVERVRLLASRVEGAHVTVVASAAAEIVTDHVMQCDAAILLDHATSRDCEMLLTAGKHLLVPWASGWSLPDIAGLNDHVRDQEIILMPGGSARFAPAIEVTRKSLENGELGDPGLVRIHRWQPADPPGVARLTIVQGLLRDIDLALEVFQGLPTEVYAISRTVQAESEADYLQVHLGFAKGGMALLDQSHALPDGDGYFSFSVLGSTGAAYADDHPNRQLVFAGGHPGAPVTANRELGLLAELQDFCSAILSRRTPRVTVEDWVAAARVAEAVEHSLKAGMVVPVKSEESDGH